MNSIPTQTIATLASILASALDGAERTEAHIADLAADLRDASNDWLTQAATVKLAAARERQTMFIANAALTLKRLETLRAQAGLDASVLGRVFQEYAK